MGLWVYPEPKRSSMTWKHPHSSTTKKIQNWAICEKTMATVFWDCEGLLMCEFLPPKTTINSDKYCETLKKFCEAIKRKRPGWLAAGVRPLHDGDGLIPQPRPWPGCKRESGKFCRIHHIVLIQHHQISTSSSYSRTFYQEKDLRTKRIARTVVQYFTSLGKEPYCEGMFKLVKRWDKCLNANNDYVEK
jgi:hypothetical protein